MSKNGYIANNINIELASSLEDYAAHNPNMHRIDEMCGGSHWENIDNNYAMATTRQPKIILKNNRRIECIECICNSLRQSNHNREKSQSENKKKKSINSVYTLVHSMLQIKI